MNVRLHTITPNAEATMAYIARVSNPGGQDNPEHARLLRYCIRHGHWSVFEHAHATLEIETSLAIAQQVTRHRSFTFSQLSRRYAGDDQAEVQFETTALRRQDSHNRQMSVDDVPVADRKRFLASIAAQEYRALVLYRDMLAAGIARECARFVLPQSTQTRLFMTGSVRSWIHYIATRTAPGVQPEHKWIAERGRDLLAEALPTVAAACGWVNETGEL